MNKEGSYVEGSYIQSAREGVFYFSDNFKVISKPGQTAYIEVICPELDFHDEFKDTGYMKAFIIAHMSPCKKGEY